ncbi:ribonucleotide reductase subunit alpha [Ideonella sp. BN130291]|uniref:ribonucleotide reductase subunit alpha n=1 Tax=Ideonella sp. BN130291 TaxID=3112940 RepID=UPI002E2731D0|nr:ribonucleotide reductase subunit alpha [Ideonella sp. BN130291]
MHTHSPTVPEAGTTPFHQLLQAAAAEAQPQRLLFVFTAAELPPDATPAQRARFERGQGGHLTPLMCVDKTLEELDSFATLADEAGAYGPPWQVVFVGALGGSRGQPPSDAQVNSALERMVEAVKRGDVDGFLAYGAQGEALTLALGT